MPMPQPWWVEQLQQSSEGHGAWDRSQKHRVLVGAGFEGRSSRKQGKDLLIEYSRRQGRLILRSRMQSWDVGAELGYWARSEAGRESIANMRGGVKEVLQLLLRYSGATSPRTIGGRRCWPEFGDEEDVRHGSARQIT